MGDEIGDGSAKQIVEEFAVIGATQRIIFSALESHPYALSWGKIVCNAKNVFLHDRNSFKTKKAYLAAIGEYMHQCRRVHVIPFGQASYQFSQLDRLFQPSLSLNHDDTIPNAVKLEATRTLLHSNKPYEVLIKFSEPLEERVFRHDLLPTIKEEYYVEGLSMMLGNKEDKMLAELHAVSEDHTAMKLSVRLYMHKPAVVRRLKEWFKYL